MRFIFIILLFVKDKIKKTTIKKFQYHRLLHPWVQLQVRGEINFKKKKKKKVAYRLGGVVLIADTWLVEYIYNTRNKEF